VISLHPPTLLPIHTKYGNLVEQQYDNI